METYEDYEEMFKTAHDDKIKKFKFIQKELIKNDDRIVEVIIKNHILGEKIEKKE